MTNPRVICPACTKFVSLYRNGRLYNHRTPDGSKCFASGAEPEQFAGVAYSPPRTTQCVYCHRTIKIRMTGAKDVVGTLWKHRVPDDEGMAYWCQGGGELPVPYSDDNNIVAVSGYGWHPDFAPDVDAAKIAAEVPPQVAELTDWWHRKAQAETGMVVRKAIEYGATDLRDIGRDIYEMAGREMPTDTVAITAGIAFYIRGKIARITAAIHENRQPSYDTWLDIGVYARMAQRVLETGGWPGTVHDYEDEDY